MADPVGLQVALRIEDPGLGEYVDRHVAEMRLELDKIQQRFSEYTDHSAKHSEQVLRLASGLVTGEISKFEKALLILFAYYHDWGMVVSDAEYNAHVDLLGDDIEVQVQVENLCGRDDMQKVDIDKGRLLLALEHFRQTHAARSAKMVRAKCPKESPASFFGEIYLWDVVASLCEAHQADVTDILADPSVSSVAPIGSGVSVDLVFLMAVSRMADACHFARDRALPFLRIGKQFASGRSARIWKHHADVADTVLNRDTHRIEIHAKCADFYAHRAIINNARQMQTELVRVHRLLAEKASKHRFDWKYVDTSAVVPAKHDYDYHDSRFSLDRANIIGLLMGNRLYPNELYALRECIQNAVDAVVTYRRRIGGGCCPCTLVDVSTPAVVDVYDNGTGMDKDIIDKHFLSVGSSAFWYSDRGVKEWGGIERSTWLVADHGIGTLSYFMLADKIEIFTVYGPSNEHVHVLLDDYLDGVVFKSTPRSAFPRSSNEQVRTIWDQGHGTLIRMHLKRPLDPVEVLDYLGRHVLRIPSTLTIQTAERAFDTPEVWHLRRADDPLLWDSRRATVTPTGTPATAEDVFAKLYKSKRDFYQNPPDDRAVVDNAFEFGETRYRLHLDAGSYGVGQFRLSQNGIVVEDAHDFFRRLGEGLPLLHAFWVDVDVRGECFQLSANRTQIVDNTYNRQLGERLTREFVRRYFEQVAKIEAATYFPCGNRYYHGMVDILSQESLEVCFHEGLRSFFQDHEGNRHWVLEQEPQFCEAKLYCVGKEANRPISVNEIEKDDALRDLLVLRSGPLASGRGSARSRGRKSTRLSKFIATVEANTGTPESLVYVPGGSKAFVLPLALRFTLSVKYEHEDFRILRIERGSERDISASLRVLTSE